MRVAAWGSSVTLITIRRARGGPAQNDTARINTARKNIARINTVRYDAAAS
jgi:ribosomal protein L29